MRLNFPFQHCDDLLDGRGARRALLVATICVCCLTLLMGLPAEGAEPPPLAANVNLRADAADPAFARNGWERRITTDVTSGSADAASPAVYRRVISQLQAGGAPLIGTYFQGGDAWLTREAETRWPQRALYADELPADAFCGPSGYPQRLLIDWTQESVRKAWAERAAWHIGQRTGCNAAMIDGVSLPWAEKLHSNATGRDVAWSDRIDALDQLALALPDMKILANVAGAIGAWSDAELDLLCSSHIAGILVEQPLRWRDGGGVQKTVAQVRRLTDCGKTVILIAVADVSGLSSADVETAQRDEEQFVAALAMLCRRDPDSPVYATARFFKPAADWERWPVDLGPPRGEVQRSTSVAYRPYGGSTVSDYVTREFANGMLRLDPAAARGVGRTSGAALLTKKVAALPTTQPARTTTIAPRIGGTAERLVK